MKKRAIKLEDKKPRSISFMRFKDEPEPEKKPKYSYFIAYLDRNNKVKNMLSNFWYEINTRKNFKKFTQELNQRTLGDYREIIFFKKLKFVEGEDD